MRNFTELQNADKNEIYKLEDTIRNQEEFDKLSDYEKTEMFKDYLYLQAKDDPRFQTENAEALYYEILLGEDGLTKLLDTVADRVHNGSDVMSVLEDEQMKNSIFQGSDGLSTTTDNALMRENIIEEIKRGNYRRLHSQVVQEKAEKTADNLRIHNAELKDVEEQIELFEELNKSNKPGNVSGDLDQEIADNKDVLDFISDLDKATDQAEVDAFAEVEQDYIDALFHDDPRAKKKLAEVDEKREIYEKAADKVLKEEKEAASAVDNMLNNLDDIEKELDAENKDDILSVFEDSPEYKKYADPLNEAYKNKASFEEADIKGEELELNMMEEQLFPTNDSVQKSIRERGKALKPMEVPNMTADEILKASKEFEEDFYDNQLGSLNYQNKSQEQMEDFKEDMKNAQKLADELDAGAEKAAKAATPIVEKRNAAYSELDRIEQIFLDQQQFEKLEDYQKKSLATEYLKKNAVTLPGYDDSDDREIDIHISSTAQRPLDYLVRHLKSGKNFLTELSNPYMQKQAYGEVFNKNPYEYTDDDAKRSFERHVDSVSEIEKSNFREHGTYDGSPKKEEKKTEKKVEENAEDIPSVEELFPENEKVLEEKARREREAQEKEERIENKKIMRSAMKYESERVKDFKPTKLQEAQLKGINETGKKMVESLTGIKEDEAERLKKMSEAEAKAEMKRLEKQMTDSSHFNSLSKKEKLRLAQDYLFCMGKENEACMDLRFELMDDDSMKRKADAMHFSIYSYPLGVTAFNNDYEYSNLNAAISKTIDKVTDGKEFFDIVSNSKYLLHRAAEGIKSELRAGSDRYDIHKEEKEFNKDIEAAVKKQQEKEKLRKSSKGFDKSYENYVILHTGSKAGATKEDLITNLAKVCAAEKMKNSNKKFDVEEVRKSADRIRQSYSLDVFSKLKDDKLLDDGKAATQFVRKIKESVFKVDPKNYDAYKASMKKILDNMDSPKGRTDKYQRFYNSIKAITELKTNDSYAEDDLIMANDELYDATLAYMEGKENVRVQGKGKRAFNNSLDVLSEMTKYVPGTNLSTMKEINKINQVRKSKKQPTIETDLKKFTEEYGAKRAEEAKQNKGKEKTNTKMDVGPIMGK